MGALWPRKKTVAGRNFAASDAVKALDSFAVPESLWYRLTAGVALYVEKIVRANKRVERKGLRSMIGLLSMASYLVRRELSNM
jgi:hypothetical protein